MNLSQVVAVFKVRADACCTVLQAACAQHMRQAHADWSATFQAALGGNMPGAQGGPSSLASSSPGRSPLHNGHLRVSLMLFGSRVAHLALRHMSNNLPCM